MHGLFRWSGKWWPGVVPLVLLWAIAAWNDTAAVEADLVGKAAGAVKGIVLDKVSISADGRDVTFGADAFTEEGRHGALIAVGSVPGVRLVNDESRLVPEAKPYVWSAEREVAKVTLAGNAPLPAVKAKLMDVARAEVKGIEISDQMQLARGAPEYFEDAAALLIGQISKLRDGKVALSDRGVTLSGIARDLGGREGISAALKNLPQGFSVTANDVKAPPYIFQANKDPVALTLTLSGYVPDENVHAVILGSASRKFFSEKVVDKLKTSVGAPYQFVNAVIPALGVLSRLSTATLVVSDRKVKISGDALYDAAAAQIKAGLPKEFPKDWQVKADISVKPASAPVDGTVCQQLFNDLLSKAQIRFLTGRATIDSDSAGLLDHLIETALRCPSTNIEIAGHTDSDGEEAANQILSERRAKAVLDYFVKAGLPKERFTATGYGSSQPIASNDTDEGKAKNRRIEFLVRKP
jgi:OOP family OmpA-OmpF porin